MRYLAAKTSNVIWQKRFSPNSTAQYISDSHDHILVFARHKQQWQRNLLPREEKQNQSYKNPDNDPRGAWTSGDLSARNSYSAGIYSIDTPAGRTIAGLPKGMFWRVSKEKFQELDRDRRIWWGKNRDNTPRLKRFLSEVMEGIVPQTIWLHDDVGNTQEAKTTQSLAAEQLQALSDEIGPDRTLLVCCGAFRGSADRFQNLTVKKIPKMVLAKCEWGRDDYSLNVANLSMAEPIAESAASSSTSVRADKAPAKDKAQDDLFGGDPA